MQQKVMEMDMKYFGLIRLISIIGPIREKLVLSMEVMVLDMEKQNLDCLMESSLRNSSLSSQKSIHEILFQI
jgi:hypothetical protein